MRTAFNFYVDSNIIRKVVISLCQLSHQVFEISLNSSLITDELSSQKADYQTYTVYSEKLNLISMTLDNISKNLLQDSSTLLEQSLESTKYQERYVRLGDALTLITREDNVEVVTESLRSIEARLHPISDRMVQILQSISKNKTNFDHSLKKLWLLHTNLKVEAEKDEINILAPILQRTEAILEEVGGLVDELDAGMRSLEKQLNGKEQAW